MRRLVSEPFEDLFTVDRVVHEPARLAMLTILEACECADFLFLASATGVSLDNISGHLAKLEAVGLVAITSRVRWRRAYTEVRLTPAGRAGIREHWRRLDEARRAAEGWRVLAPPLVH
jgi:DNA-binding transcriptional ArsR family regulator